MSGSYAVVYAPQAFEDLRDIVYGGRDLEQLFPQ